MIEIKQSKYKIGVKFRNSTWSNYKRDSRKKWIFNLKTKFRGCKLMMILIVILALMKKILMTVKIKVIRIMRQQIRGRI